MSMLMLEMYETMEKIIELIALWGGIAQGQIHPQTDILQATGKHRQHIVELAEMIEMEFKIDIPRRLLYQLDTPQRIFVCICLNQTARKTMPETALLATSC